MKCCNKEMVPDGGGLACSKCGNWLSALEVKFGQEPPIKDYQDKRMDWH